MFKKIYLMMWTTFFAVAVLFLIAGYMTMTTLVVFGFISFGLVFMGMMCVLPSTVGHHGSDSEAFSEQRGLLALAKLVTHSLFSSNGVEMVKPEFRSSKGTILHH